MLYHLSIACLFTLNSVFYFGACYGLRCGVLTTNPSSCVHSKVALHAINLSDGLSQDLTTKISEYLRLRESREPVVEIPKKYTVQAAEKNPKKAGNVAEMFVPKGNSR